MQHPERSPFACVGPDNAQGGGDPDFLASPVLSAERAPDPAHAPSLSDQSEWLGTGRLSDATIELALEFGYR